MKEYKFKIMPRWLFGILAGCMFFMSIVPLSYLFEGNFDLTHFLGIPILMISLIMAWMFWVDKFVFYGELTGKEVEEENEKRRKDLGYFTYSDDGFGFKDKTQNLKVRWSDIEEIGAYKRDIYYVDQVVLQLKISNRQELIITEDTAGYYQFTEQVNKNLDGVLYAWDLRVVFPAFEKSATLVYSKGRDLNEEESKDPGS